MTTGDRLREERERLRMTQEELGKALGLKSKQVQSNYERNISSPDNDYWRGAADLGVDIYYVLTGKRIIDQNKHSNFAKLELVDTLKSVQRDIEIAIEQLNKAKIDDEWKTSLNTRDYG
jgi:transcriptional regulator with XRE-family HTH domain